MLFSLLLSLNLAMAGDWKSLGITDGVQVYQKQESGSGLYAFKGTSTTELSVAQLMGVLRDESISKEWVDMMVFATVIEQYSDTHVAIHQGYDLPWPVSDRDYVFDKKIVLDPTTKTASVHLTSIEHPKAPVSTEYVRARGERTYWKFTVNAEGTTDITVEVLTDPEGALPDWAVNSIQADWPHKSINALLKRAAKGDVTPDSNCVGWQGQ